MIASFALKTFTKSTDPAHTKEELDVIYEICRCIMCCYLFSFGSTFVVTGHALLRWPGFEA